MLKKIVETTATSGLSNVSSRKLFKVGTGEYSGRMVGIVRTSSSELVFSYSDPPCREWSTPAAITNDVADLPYDAVMDANGNIHLVYCEQSTLYPVIRKLSFTSGEWSIGDKVYVYNGNTSLAPSISIEVNGRLWVSRSQLAASNYDIRLKYSDDSGATWGSGPTDPGEAIMTGLTACQSKVVISLSHIHIICAVSGSSIIIRSKPLSGSEWSAEYTIATGVGIDDHFDAAVADNGLLGVVYDDGQLCYREYDGSNWSPAVTLDENAGDHPQLEFVANVPLVTYRSELAAGQSLVKYTHRRTGIFSSPGVLNKGANLFTGVILYDAGSASYADVTDAASSEQTADLYHPSSGVLMANTGDAIYLGMEQRFRLVRMLLATPGVGGTVCFSYFDGTSWQSFTPSGGNYNLDVADKNLPFWDDLVATSAGWQRSIVNGESNYWIKVEVVSDFTSGPIGSRVTSVANLTSLACGR